MKKSNHSFNINKLLSLGQNWSRSKTLDDEDLFCAFAEVGVLSHKRHCV